MNKNKLILVDLIWTRDKDPRVPLGHASLLAALYGNNGLEVDSVIVPVNCEVVPEAIAANLIDRTQGYRSGQVDIAISAYVWGEELLVQILSALRRRGFTGRIILGGPQISYCGPTLEKHYPQADVFIRGYGEEALAELVSPLGRRDIPGVHRAGSMDRVAQADTNLECLRSPWLLGLVSLENQPFIRWETQRGCPFKCSFCQHREPGARLRTTTFAWERIEAEIDLFCESEVQEIAVLDPVFNVRGHGTRVLERFASNGFKGRLALQCRAEMVDDAFLDAASALDVCLEFGLQTIHRSEYLAISRPNNMEKVDAALEAVRARGIVHEVSLIFGLPNQTLESFHTSVDWCLERRVPVVKAFPLLLLRGTQLHLDRSKWGLQTDGKPMGMVIASDTFTEEDWDTMNRISETLSRSEGHHPRNIAEISTNRKQRSSTHARWQSQVKTTT